MNKKYMMWIFVLLLLVPNVLGLTISYNKGGDTTFPACNEDEYLIYQSGAWACTTLTSTGGFDLTCTNGQFTFYNTSSSAWECTDPPTSTGGSFDLTCSNGQNTIYNTTTNGWECGIDSTGTDTTLTEEEVITFVENNDFINSSTISSIYYNTTEIDTTLTGYYLSSVIDSMFSNYYNTTQINSLFTNYYTITEIDTTFTNYYRKTELDNTYLFNQSCSDGQLLQFNTTSDSWDCITQLTGGTGDVQYDTYWNNSGYGLEIDYIQFEGSNITYTIEELDNNIVLSQLQFYHTLDTADISGSTITDMTGNSYSGTITGATTGVTGSNNEAIELDGTTDFYEVNSPPPASDTGTISLHVKFDTITDQDVLFSFGDDTLNSLNYLFLGVTNGDELTMYGATPNVNVDTTNANLVTGEWYHIVVKSDGSQYYFYKNGTLLLTTGTNNGQWNNDVPSYDHITIGALTRSTQTYQDMDGIIDEVAYWNRDLISTEIDYLFTSDAKYTLYESDLVNTSTTQFSSRLQSTDLTGVGNGYLCVNSEGLFYRSSRACS